MTTPITITESPTAGLYNLYFPNGIKKGATLVECINLHAWRVSYVGVGSFEKDTRIIREELDLSKKGHPVESTWCSCKCNCEGEKCLHAQVLEKHLGRELTGLKIYGYTMRNGAIAAM